MLAILYASLVAPGDENIDQVIRDHEYLKCIPKCLLCTREMITVTTKCCERKKVK